MAPAVAEKRKLLFKRAWGYGRYNIKRGAAGTSFVD